MRLDSRVSRIVTLDVIFRAGLGVGFVIMIVMAYRMPQTSFGNPAAYPLFVGYVGLTLWVASTVHEVFRTLRGGKQGRIYDISFETEGIAPRVVWLRTLWVFLIMGAVILGVYLVNFHIAIPAFLIVYLRYVGKGSWGTALLAALVLELPIILLYGVLIHTAWPDSLIERIFNFSLQDFLDGPLG